MDNKNYYQEIIGKINHFITKQAWQEALELVRNELQVTYVPKEYYEHFINLHSEIVLNIKQLENVKVQSQIWTLDKISAIIMNPLESDMHLVAFYHLQNHNVRLILPIIRNYLLNNQFNNINKTQLLVVLKSQAVNEDFKVIKSHGVFQVNPIKLVFWNETTSYKKTSRLLNQVQSENPGLYQICLFLLDNYYESLTPNFPIVKHCAALAAAIYIRAWSLQFIKVTLLSSASKFHSTPNLIKKYLLELNQHKIT